MGDRRWAMGDGAEVIAGDRQQSGGSQGVRRRLTPHSSLLTPHRFLL
jgi:hypothetical protein